MRTVYFLSGLDSNRLYLNDLIKYMPKYHIKQIDLPGHGTSYDIRINNLNELEQWFLKEIDNQGKEIILIGHSLGADIASYLATRLKNIGKLILLDGGLINLSELGYSLEQELKDTENFLETEKYTHLSDFIDHEKEDYKIWTTNLEKASVAKMKYNLSEQKYEISLNSVNAKQLLALRRQISFPTFKDLTLTGVLVLIPEKQDNSIITLKKTIIDKYNVDNMTHAIVPNSGHDIYLDNPKEVGKIINDWLSI